MLVLFGRDKHIKTDVWLDDMLLREKFSIYKCRINKSKPNVQHFMNEMKYIYKIDKYVLYLEMKSDKFYQKWQLYINLIN